MIDGYRETIKKILLPNSKRSSYLNLRERIEYQFDINMQIFVVPILNKIFFHESKAADINKLDVDIEGFSGYFLLC